jgi:hypothetical protein
MSLKYGQVTKKDQVLAEIERAYLSNPSGRPRWDMNTFTFSPPSEHWLKKYKALDVFEVELQRDGKRADNAFIVHIIGPDKSRGYVGHIISHD